jgi:hypothetical protein
LAKKTVILMVVKELLQKLKKNFSQE